MKNEDKKSISLNCWEELFLEFLDMTEFYLRKRIDEKDNECFSLVDGQRADLGDIESEKFYSASEILDRMEIYEDDYIIKDLEECAQSENIELQYNMWSDLLKYRGLMENNEGDFDLIDMICNHADEIDINKVYNYLEA